MLCVRREEKLLGSVENDRLTVDSGYTPRVRGDHHGILGHDGDAKLLRIRSDELYLPRDETALVVPVKSTWTQKIRRCTKYRIKM